MKRKTLYLRITGRPGTRKVPAPRNYPTHISLKLGGRSRKLPVAYFEKDAVSVGFWRHPQTHQVLPVTRKRIDRWVSRFRAMRRAGIEIPTPVDHSEAAEDNYGFVVGARRVGDVLKVTTQAIGEKGAELAARNRCSVCVEDFVDGKGRDWGEAITHCALTPKPVVHGHGQFVPFAASRGAGAAKIPVFYLSRQEKRAMKLSKKMRRQIRKILGLAPEDDLTASVVVPGLLKAAMKSKKAAAGRRDDQDEDDDLIEDVEDLEDEEDEEEDEDDDLEEDERPPRGRRETNSETGDQEDEEDEEEDEDDLEEGVERQERVMASRNLDPATSMLLSRSLRTEIKQAVKSGGLDANAAKSLKQLLFAGKNRPSKLALSMVGDEPVGFQLMQILQGNRPVPLREKTGSQERVALSRRDPSESRMTRKEREELEEELRQTRRWAKKRSQRPNGVQQRSSGFTT